MCDAGGPGSAIKCLGLALTDLGDTEGFDKVRENNQLYAFQLSDGVYKRKEVTQEKNRSLNFEELSNANVSHADPKQTHTLAFTGGKWFAFADPIQQTGWLIDIKLSSPCVVTVQQHKVRKIMISGTLPGCALISPTRKTSLFPNITR